ncbi:MAG: DUF362 domain-containing protein [Acidobacteria bacterium]|nr:MAG: DUF362 domain-containing protein [Acidobacteriota bacterium]
MAGPPRVPRRRFLAVTGLGALAAACRRGGGDADAGPGCPGAAQAAPSPHEGRVVLARTGSAERNAAALLDAWGGIESLVGPEDVVVLKVNAQWWGQGMSCTDVLAGLIAAILGRPGGFSGDVIVADNHHFRRPLSRGWTTERPNGRFNLVQLVEHFAAQAPGRVQRVHWTDAGPNPEPWQGDAGGGVRVDEPGAGEGYRWWLDECHVTPEGHRCAMTWPSFRIARTGEIADLRDGVFRDGAPTGRPLRFWNVSSLNFHSRYAGVTASIKNLMGVVDMTCGFQGPEPPGYFNTHYIGMRPSHATWRWAKRRGGVVRRVVHKLIPEESALDFRHTGGALAHWIRTVRRPDLNVVTAEWIGFGSRTDEALSARPGVSLAATDPVTLDAVAAREVLLPATREAGDRGRFYLPYNDPDRTEGPFRRFLEQARLEIGGRPEAGAATIDRVS